MSTIKQYTSAGEAAADLTVDEAQLVLDKGAQALKDAGVDKLSICSAGWQDGGYDDVYIYGLLRADLKEE